MFARVRWVGDWQQYVEHLRIAAKTARALYLAGVRGIKDVYYVEINKSRKVVAEHVWKRYYEEATFNAYDMDIRDVHRGTFEEAAERAAGVILIAGSPCNNITKNNRATGPNGQNPGFEGQQSSLFYQIPQILHAMNMQFAFQSRDSAAAGPAPM